jgi:hypothetical protein
MYIYRGLPVLQEEDDKEADLDTWPFDEDINSLMGAGTTHDENKGCHDDAPADGRVETRAEMDANEAQRDGPSGETDTNPMLDDGGEGDGPRGETDASAVLVNEAQRDSHGDDSTETSTEMQVDTSAAAPTPHVEMDPMQDIVPTMPASANDVGDTAQNSAPSWITEAKQYLLSIPAGEKWEKLVYHWMEIEKRLGYPDGSVRCFLFSSADIKSNPWS